MLSLQSAHRWIVPVFISALLGGCATPGRVATTEPANLYPHKLELRAYVDSGDYQRGLARVAETAQRWVQERGGQRRAGERLAVVFDLDETLLLNRPSRSESDFG